MSGLHTTSHDEFRVDLSGTIALVTGASRGIGVRLASTLAASGAAVALVGRDAEALRALEARIIEGGGRAASFPQDLLRSDQAGILFDRVEAALGPVDLLVNNAGTSVSGRAIENSDGDFDRVFHTNVKAAFALACEAARRLIERGQPGGVINIASINAELPRSGLALYCMSKASLVMMTKVLAREWARFGINVNAILPGAILTDMTRDIFEAENGIRQIASFRRRRLMQPEDLDGILLLLAAKQARAITGATIVVDDGQLP